MLAPKLVLVSNNIFQPNKSSSKKSVSFILYTFVYVFKRRSARVKKKLLLWKLIKAPKNKGVEAPIFLALSNFSSFAKVKNMQRIIIQCSLFLIFMQNLQSNSWDIADIDCLLGWVGWWHVQVIFIRIC